MYIYYLHYLQADLDDPPVHVPGVEEDGVEVCEGGEEAAVVRDVAVGDGAAGRHEGVMTEPEPGSGYSLELATKVREGFTITKKAPTRASP